MARSRKKHTQRKVSKAPMWLFGHGYFSDHAERPHRSKARGGGWAGEMPFVFYK